MPCLVTARGNLTDGSTLISSNAKTWIDANPLTWWCKLAASKNCLEDRWDPQNQEVKGPLLILECEEANILELIIHMTLSRNGSP